MGAKPFNESSGFGRVERPACPFHPHTQPENSAMATDDRPIPQRTPIVGPCEAGEYWWCSCGRSQNQPFCDGSHKTSNYLPMRVLVSEDRKVAWCACKRTKTPPWCDGSHKQLPPGDAPPPSSRLRPPIPMD